MKSGPLKWHGGKAYLAPKIRALFPPHTRYVEPFFGGGAVLLAGDGEGVSEFANDLNRNLTDFWRVLGDVRWFPRFQRYVETIPMSKVEFEDAKEPQVAIVERAAAFFVRCRQSRQGLMKDFATPTSRTRRGMNENVSAWLSAVEGLPDIHARMKRVEIRNQDACSLIRELDSPETLFYCDPPYLHETRSSTGEYQCEMTEEQHSELLGVLAGIKGKFLLSGYRSILYDETAAMMKWRRIDFEIDNKASSAKVKEKKTECVWMNF